MVCCFSAFLGKKVLCLQHDLNIMSYNLSEKEAIKFVDTENTLSQKELEDRCYSLEESKRLLVKKIHFHYAVHSLLYH